MIVEERLSSYLGIFTLEEPKHVGVEKSNYVVRCKMRVIFWKGQASFFGTLIRLKTGSSYTHCELLFSDGTRFGIYGLFKSDFYRVDGKIRTPDVISGYDGKEWNAENWDCISIDGGDEEKVRKWCEKHRGLKYDWKGIVFCQVFPWGIESKNKWFCSELVTSALQEGGFPQVKGLKPYQIAPHKLASILENNGGKFALP